MKKEILWAPDNRRKRSSNMFHFMEFINKKFGYNFDDYTSLYQWSVECNTDFWRELLLYSQIKYSGDPDNVISGESMPGFRWFQEVKLNFAENILARRDGKVAIYSSDESSVIREVTYKELFDRVTSLAAWMKNRGLKKGDRVCGYVANVPEAVITMLAATSIGAIWSSTSPDFGAEGVLERFSQINPRMILITSRYYYNGKLIDCTDKISNILKSLDSVKEVIFISGPDPKDSIIKASGKEFFNFSDLTEKPPKQFIFEKFEFEHPVYILYSSGTTGKPKCIVHGAGGVLLQHYKEHSLHTDINDIDIVFYFTTCGWMMWNWLVSVLQTGASIVLYDGNPFYPSTDILWRLADKTKINVFGTSPRYISGLEQAKYTPSSHFELKHLRTILSTGSPLSADNFRWIYKNIKNDILLSSISGGTDIISCFMLGSPLLPVIAGLIQCRGLGMAVESLGANGEPVRGKPGELVCTLPAPSMPVFFWNDTDGSKYRNSYFSTFPGIWKHGDFIQISEDGQIIVFGRSDATLNPGGVRIGTAEIYNIVETFSGIKDALVIGRNDGSDVDVYLFIVTEPGLLFNQDYCNKLKNEIKLKLSPRHVPKRIFSVPDIPRTLNGKKVEVAANRIINGKEIDNRDSIINPESLVHFEQYEKLPNF